MSRIKPRPRHHIITTNVGGQSGKSTLAMMLVAFLASHPDASTVIIIDIVSPYVGVYDCFENIFAATSISLMVENSPVIKAPKLDQRDARNILVVKVQRGEVETWDQQIKKIQKIQEHMIYERGYTVTHVITESNLQPDQQNAAHVFTDIDYSALTYWTIWNRESMYSERTYEDLAAFQRSYHDLTIHFQFVHNAYQEVDGWEGEDMPAMKECHAKTDPHVVEPNEQFKLLMTRAKEAKQSRKGGLDGNEFYEHVYQDYFERGYKPANLLPLFRRSRAFTRLMPNKFVGIDPIQDVQQLGELLDITTEQFYSIVFKPHFGRMHV